MKVPKIAAKADLAVGTEPTQQMWRDFQIPVLLHYVKLRSAIKWYTYFRWTDQLHCIIASERPRNGRLELK